MSILLSSIVAVAAGQSFTCTPIRVWDGDGPVWCAEGPRIRLAGIAAREIDETCRAGQPCPKASGHDARDYLASLMGRETGRSPQGHILVRGPALTCVSTGPAGGTRTGAWCESPLHGDISCKMVASGFALKWPRYWADHRCTDPGR